MELLLVVLILALLNGAQMIINQIDRKRMDRRENFLIKAIMSKNVQEFSFAEETPGEALRRMELENENAERAVKILKDKEDLHVPVI